MAKKSKSGKYSDSTLMAVGVGAILLTMWYFLGGKNGNGGNGEVLKSQLGQCWDYISGAGTHYNDLVIWAYREDKWLFYSSLDPGSTLSQFNNGDYVKLYAIQPCALIYAETAWNLVEGWNEGHWPGGYPWVS